jgi:hypothetical protein
MRPGPVALAALLMLACAGRAGASPLLPSFVGAALQSKVDVEAVGWRYRHTRSYFWGGRRSGDVARDGADSLASRSNADIETTPWRRHRRDYDRNDRVGASASALRDETDGSGATLTRPTTSGAAWPDRRRRRGWVDPPPAR